MLEKESIPERKRMFAGPERHLMKKRASGGERWETSHGGRTGFKETRIRIRGWTHRQRSLEQGQPARPVERKGGRVRATRSARTNLKDECGRELSSIPTSVLRRTSPKAKCLR